MDTERFHRQILLFGPEGQKKIAATRAAIVGVGGTGSHIVQQLAYLGVRQFQLIDADIVTPTSLNRLIGALPADIAARTPKVHVAERLIRGIDPSLAVNVVADTFVSRLGAAALEEANVVFGCVDTDGARLLLTEWATAFDRPYLDVATDTLPDGDFGGRLVVSVAGGGCPYCMDELDQEAIHRSLAPPERRDEEDALYGVPRSALAEHGPSVVCLNGVLASLAVMEFIILVTGHLRKPKALQRYHGRKGIVTTLAEQPPEQQRPCPYCSKRGTADRAEWMRHVRAGLGKWVR